MGVGIVTRMDDIYFYVWSWGHGYKEFRCRKVPGKEFKHGEHIYFTSPNENVETLDSNRCERASRQLTVFPSRNCIWKVECLITFAPKEFDVFKKIQEQLPNCKALAFSDEFCYVASFKDNVHIKTGDVYKSYVTRIPSKYDEWIPKLGTPFCLIDKHEKIFDREKAHELLHKVPWKKIMGSDNSRRNSSTTSTEKNILSKKIYSTTSNLFDERPDSDENDEKTEEEQQNKFNFIKSNIFQLDNNEPKNDFQNYSNNFEDQKEDFEQINNNTKIVQKSENQQGILKKCGQQNLKKEEENDEIKIYTGLVVEADKFGLIIWNRTHDLVRAPALPIIGLEKRWPISTWVNYRAFFDDSGSSSQQQNNNNIIAHFNRCQYTAYDIFTSDVDRPVLFRKAENTIQMECQLFGPIRYVGDDLILVNEPFLGIVLCAKDLRLVQRLEYGWTEYVTAFITFTKEYPDLCRWIALAIKCTAVDGEWLELEKPLIAKSMFSEGVAENRDERLLENFVERSKENEECINQNYEEIERDKCYAFNGFNMYSHKKSHHIHSISTGVCDFSLNSITPSSSNSPPLENNILNNNKSSQEEEEEDNLIYWNEFDENNNYENEENDQNINEITILKYTENPCTIKKHSKTTPKLIEIDGNKKGYFLDNNKNKEEEEEFIYLRKIGLTSQEFCSFFTTQQQQGIVEDENNKNKKKKNLVEEEDNFVVKESPIKQNNNKPVVVILPSFDASQVEESSLTQIDFSPPQQLLPDFSIEEYANKYFNDNENSGGTTDFIKL